MISGRQRKTAVFISGVLALSAAATGVALLGKEHAEVQAAAPNTTREFLIGSWTSFYDTARTSYEDQLEDLARSGINWITNPTASNAPADVWTLPQYTNTQLNEIYKPYNMYFSAVASTPYIVTMDDSNKMVEEVTAGDLLQCNSYYVRDEPSDAIMQTTGDIFLNILKKDPSRFPWVGLYPTYAGASNLGGSYADYVQRWVDTVGAENLEYLSYDHYPFTASEEVRASYFSDLETIRKVAYDNGKLKTMGASQLGWWNGMRRPSPDMARWNLNSFLAYGLKGIIHFCWVSPYYVAPADGGEGMRDFVLTAEGEKTDLYEPMQKLNWQIRQLGPLLMEMDVAHAYHVNKVALGAESLPKSFVFQPTNSSDNLIFSLAYGKNGEDIYAMVFNNEIEGEKKTVTIAVDPTSGVSSLTRYTADSFDVLPDYTESLPAPKEERVDVSGGTFSVELEPGGLAIYKLNGDVSIKEPLKSPRLSLRSGTYLGEQSLEISSSDEGAEIYYTTDGSYPSYTSQRYTAPIKIGNGREFGQYIVKAIAIRGTEISDAVTGEYIIGDGSENVALGKPVTFTVPVKAITGSATASYVTDGNVDPYNVWGSVENRFGFAIVDLGGEYTVDKLVVKAYHDWNFEDVVLQTALDKDFTQGVYTVFNNDADDSVGAGKGTDGNYTEVGGSVGHVFKFEPRSVRYIRFHNRSTNGVDNYSMWEEIQAYTAYDGGADLLANSADWKITGGGTWVWNNDGSVSQTGEVNRTMWNRSYTYTKKKFKNFILEGNFTMKANGPDDWGYVGFGLYKPNINDLQSDFDHGFYACVEPRGRVLLWNGAKPELGPEDANISGFGFNTEFTLRVVSIDDTISVSVNGKPIMYVRGEVFDREAGYISIHSGLIPVTVSSMTITELGDSAAPLFNEQCLKEGRESRMAVPRFTEKADVLAQLPAKAIAKDTEGREYELNVTWYSDSYDCATTGFATFTGEFTDLPKGLVNPYRITATMNVFVQPELDKSELEKLVEIARGLDPENFTEDSFAQILSKTEAAEDMLLDPFLVQSDLGVGVFQLYDAIYKYAVSTVDKASLAEAIREATGALPDLNCTEAGRRQIEEALSSAQEIYGNVLSTPKDVADAEKTLKGALAGAAPLQQATGPLSEPPAPYSAPKTYSAAYIAAGVAGGAVLAAGGIALASRKKKKKED